MSFLEIDRAVKQFGGLRAVSDVSFTLEKGEVVGLLGPNGSGKTTLINLVSGALPATSGDIRLDGLRLTGLSRDRIARAGVARTFQLVRTLPSLSLVENVMITAVFGRHAHWGAAARRVALGALEMVGLSDRAGVAAADLTYIDQKRLELARALAAEPEILLLDEWLAGLNPTELAEGVALIRTLHQGGLTILMVEHIIDAVRALCPRVVVMNSGELIADAPTDIALADPMVVSAYLGGEVDA
ncbi:ABC transporter ATP-binding protein [Pseudooceanicola sediminis]|uniref:ABC transporter ATP-binding protein n=1 Tax=Pseudooceanicola sediminis TaxID=2211117 RepID=A0A399J2A9_9RHOB|nr:ABC transporter ATP-binding protein [Pseudooceanicola sediminis]KAA2314685.1 ABC transporter ATP-binding protein [Puniceibacterium sp. HSS470]RII39361.1 ABC transporter ATP-binding protein [Pseudooceanicola sediminis]|tara:strand:- start:218720 stop:219448 length:729 start_codon:yes stop_codon:yes gene_type:complete